MRIIFPGALSISTGAVPVLAPGLGHMAPTYFVGSRDRHPTATVAPRFLIRPPSFGFFRPRSDLMPASAAKAALRSQALARRGLINGIESRAFTQRLANIGAGIVAEKKAHIVSAFWSIGDEPATLPLLHNLARQGVLTALPVMQGRGTPLLFRLWKEGEPLAEVKWGIKEPLPEAREVQPDLLFVPLAAYDRAGNRLGYGAGYYDRTLAELRAAKSITAVGVAFDIQEMAEIPVEAYDEKLDYVLTDHEWIVCK